MCRLLIVARPKAKWFVVDPIPVGDGNPEAILVGAPLDGTKNPKGLKLGDSVTNITGILTYVYDYYTILPLTAPALLSSLAYNPPLSPFTSSIDVDAAGCQGVCVFLVHAVPCPECYDVPGVTVGDYNVDNLSPTSSARVNFAALHIVNYLKSPDLLWIQEIQDGSGPADNGVVSANVTLNALTASILQQGGPAYKWAEIDPIDGTVRTHVSRCGDLAELTLAFVLVEWRRGWREYPTGILVQA